MNLRNPAWRDRRGAESRRSALLPLKFRDGSHDCPPPAKDEVFVRLVTSYATLPSDVDGFMTLAMTADANASDTNDSKHHQFEHSKIGAKKRRLIETPLPPSGVGRPTNARGYAALDVTTGDLRPRLQSGSGAVSAPRGVHEANRHEASRFQGLPRSHGRDPRVGSGARTNGRHSLIQHFRFSRYVLALTLARTTNGEVFSLVSSERSVAAKPATATDIR